MQTSRRNRAVVGALLATAAAWSPGLLSGPPPMEERVAACAACHGRQGRSAAETYYPSIAGKPAGYLYQQLRHFREGRRQHEVMAHLLAFLSDDYLHDMAQYYAAQTPVGHHAVTDAPAAVLARGRQLAEQGDAARDVPSCRSCHGAALAGVSPSIPGLTGLRVDYLAAQLGAWRSQTRRAAEPDCMRTVAQRLAFEDIEAVSAWIASRPAGAAEPKSTVLVPLPLRCGGLP